MNKVLKIILPLAGAAVAAAAVTALAVAPGRATEDQKAPFMRRNFAHRGLHKLDRSVPENSLAAFKEAMEAGYGVELDVRLTADGEVVVFHDSQLERMCGVEGRIEELSYTELVRLSLAQTGEGIPRLIEVFDLIDGRVPIIIELKSSEHNLMLCEKTLQLMDNYYGQVCIESFDPKIVRWFRVNAPDILRGQLSCRPGRFSGDVKRPLALILGNLLTNFLGRPQFIAYGVGKKPLMVKLCQMLGAMIISWTSHDVTDQESSDAVIFEYYRPETEY